MEGFLSVVAGKIGSALVDEAAKGALSFLWSEESLLTGINGSMRRVKREFDQIKASIGEMDKQRDKKTVEPWLKEVRNVAHDMEDVIDEYMYLAAEESESKFMSINCSAIKRATNARAWHQLATRVKQIEDDVTHVFVTMRQQFDIKISDDGEGSSNTSNHFIMPSQDMEDDQIIGMVKEKETLIGWMKDEEPQHFIITVWGMGGSGKTTLVKSAYKSIQIERHFDLKVWISVSQSFQHIHLLRRIYKSLTTDNKEAELELEELVEKTRDVLRDCRFLVILDDVWDPNAYLSLRNAFRGHKLGSKIVITTRINEVASLADEQCQMKHRTLDTDEAWNLFCDKAFWKYAGKRCPQELEGFGKKIVAKCGGLPLAIVAIGTLLSLKRQSDWKGVSDRLTWEFECNPALDSVKHILNLSYNDLPGYLKNCFLYCSMFPEDYKIKRARLIKLWIAEGFVQTRGAQTMEDVAEDYFNELVHRCMLQVVDWNTIGKVRACRMHDLIRELTLEVAKNENFSTVVAKSQPSSSSVNEARRLSIHSWPEARIDASSIRSLIVFDDGALPRSLLSSKPRYLRVLDLRGANIARLPDAVGDLFNLHYLNLQYTRIKRLPNSIERLHNLQTMNLRGTKLMSLPRGMTKLKNLRNLTGYKNAPKGLWNLTCLQNLKITANKELVRRLGNLTLLRKFEIVGVKGSYCQHLISSLSMMTFLNKLAIYSYDDNELFLMKGSSLVLKNLLSLGLNFRLLDADFTSLVGSLGDGIRDLSLHWSALRDDPLPQLSRLTNLTSLSLFLAYDGERLCFGTGWFPKLKILILWRLQNLSEIIMEKGSMGSLQILDLDGLSNLKQVPQGIEFQESIKELHILNCNPLLVQMVKGEQKCRVNHIPVIRIQGQVIQKHF